MATDNSNALNATWFSEGNLFTPGHLLVPGGEISGAVNLKNSGSSGADYTLEVVDVTGDASCLPFFTVNGKTLSAGQTTSLDSGTLAKGATSPNLPIVVKLSEDAPNSCMDSQSSFNFLASLTGTASTDDPTDEPTGDPTDEPTDDPTDEPTDDPTDDPTDEPTKKYPITHPDGTIEYEDGSKKLPDGTILYPDGVKLLPDGTYLLPDGVILRPDGSAKKPDGSDFIDWEDVASYPGSAEPYAAKYLGKTRKKANADTSTDTNTKTNANDGQWTSQSKTTPGSSDTQGTATTTVVSDQPSYLAQTGAPAALGGAVLASAIMIAVGAVMLKKRKAQPHEALVNEEN